MLDPINEVGRKWQASDERVPENHAGENFANDPGPPDSYEQPAQQLSTADQEQEEEDYLSRFGASHFFHPGEIDGSGSGQIGCSSLRVRLYWIHVD
jgi:hypothetical protein